MTDATPLRLVGDGEEPVERAGPTVLARAISVPAGPPWDQARAARLEARLGAPLPLAEAVYRVRRLEPWSFQRTGRYAVAYVRAREIGEVFDATAEVDGRPIRIRLISAAEQRRRARFVGATAGALVVAALLVAGAIGSALATRAAAKAELAAIDAEAASRLAQAKALEAEKRQTRLLNAEHLRGKSLSDFLGDLAWASAAKAPGAHLDQIHWENGLMGVQVRGASPPFGSVERAVIKVPKPVRPGVWLWGVGARGSAPAAPAPTAGVGP